MDTLRIGYELSKGDDFVFRLRFLIMMTRLEKAKKQAWKKAEQEAIEQVADFFKKREKELEEEALELYEKVLLEKFEKYYDEITDRILRYPR